MDLQQRILSLAAHSRHPETVSPELFEVLNLFDHWRDSTARSTPPPKPQFAPGRPPQLKIADPPPPNSPKLSPSCSALLTEAGPRHHTATHLDAAPIALNSFAKLHRRPRRRRSPRRRSHRSPLNIGGDIVLRGAFTEKSLSPNPAPTPKTRPRRSTSFASTIGTIATSGSYRRGVDIAGAHFSHSSLTPAPPSQLDFVLSPSPIVASASLRSRRPRHRILRHDSPQTRCLAAALLRSGLPPSPPRRPGHLEPGMVALEVPHLQTCQLLTRAHVITCACCKTRPPRTFSSPRTRLSRRLPLPPPLTSPWGPMEDPNHAGVRTLALWYGQAPLPERAPTLESNRRDPLSRPTEPISPPPSPPPPGPPYAGKKTRAGLGRQG